MAIRDPQRLGARVKAHRLQLYASRDAAASAAGISKDTWQRVEEGRPVRESTYVKVDKALGWAPGSCTLVGEGGEPVLAGESSPPRAGSSGLTAEAARAAAYAAARAAMPRAPIADVDEFVAEFVKALHEVGEVTNDC